jgi:hypothetical protein
MPVACPLPVASSPPLQTCLSRRRQLHVSFVASGQRSGELYVRDASAGKWNVAQYNEVGAADDIVAEASHLNTLVERVRS